MSVYKLCSKAVRDLLATPKHFTENDVIERASQKSWTEDDFKRAMTQANQIAYAYYRSGRLVRYGPVQVNGEKDYLRAASKIVYAGVKTGPKSVHTPNGTFPRLMAHEDDIAAVGRRIGTNRDDFHAWPSELHGEDHLEELQRQVEELRERVAELEGAEAPIAA